MIDLEPPNIRWEGGHRTFTAIYIALSRCRSLEGLSILRAFPERVLTIKPDSRLTSENSFYIGAFCGRVRVIRNAGGRIQWPPETYTCYGMGCCMCRPTWTFDYMG